MDQRMVRSLNYKTSMKGMATISFLFWPTIMVNQELSPRDFVTPAGKY